MVDFVPGAALTLEKEPPLPIEWETKCATELIWTLQRRKMFLSSAGNQTPYLQPIA
jgi:hypothetical protein